MDVKICCIEGCDTSNGNLYNFKNMGVYCLRHYNQLRIYGEIRKVKNKRKIPKNSICCQCGTNNKLRFFENKIYCQKHYDHMRLYGYCKERTIRDNNEIIKYEDYAEVVLYNVENLEKSRTIIDLDDIDKIKDIKWNLGSNGYAVNTKLQICMHNIIFPVNEGKTVDHENRNKLDNRKFNYRISDNAENSSNTSLRNNNKTGVIGVHWDKANNKWVASLQHNGETYRKRLSNFLSAVKYRLQLENKYFGEFSPQKHLFEEFGIN